MLNDSQHCPKCDKVLHLRAPNSEMCRKLKVTVEGWGLGFFYYVTDNVITFYANVAMCVVLILPVPQLQTQELIVRINLIPQEAF